MRGDSVPQQTRAFPYRSPTRLRGGVISTALRCRFRSTVRMSKSNLQLKYESHDSPTPTGSVPPANIDKFARAGIAVYRFTFSCLSFPSSQQHSISSRRQRHANPQHNPNVNPQPPHPNPNVYASMPIQSLRTARRDGRAITLATQLLTFVSKAEVEWAIHCGHMTRTLESSGPELSLS